MKVPEGIDYVWTVRLKNGTMVENFVEKEIEKDGVKGKELVETPFWAIDPKDIIELMVSSADGSGRLFRVDVWDRDLRPIWFRRNVKRVTSGGGTTETVDFLEGYYFGFRCATTNEKAVIKIDREGMIHLTNYDERRFIDMTQERSLSMKWKRRTTWRKFKKWLRR